MRIENEILIYDVVWAISEAIDIVSPVLNSHHKKVAYISGNIAQKMGMSNVEIQDIVLASMLHDIGAFSMEERMKALAFDEDGADLNRHAVLGYELLKDFEPLAKAAELIRYHHVVLNESTIDIPLGSYIIHFADRISLLFDEQREILEQAPRIMEKIYERRDVFHSGAIGAFESLAKFESFWVEAFLPSFGDAALRRMRFSKVIADLETLREFAKVIAQIIDFRSRFTATHSSGVAAVAMELSVFSGFSERECKMMEIAGYLHDLGKLAVPNEILEKNGALSDVEFNVVRKHTYFTYVVLSKIRGLEHITTWAAQHHERSDGNGYPFHIKGGDFSKLSRIMAAADIVTALTEDRPYRLGMDREEAEETLQGMVKNGGIDRNIVEIVNNNFSHINEVRKNAQQRAKDRYNAFHNSALEIAEEQPSAASAASAGCFQRRY